MKAVATVLVLIGSLSLQGCSVKDAAFGIERTDVSQIQIGWSREQVEELLDAPIDAFECPGGTRTKYIYDRLPPVEPNLGEAAGLVAFELLTLGASEIYHSCREKCQRGILDIVFDDNDTVMLLRPLSEPYDVGDLCSRGDGWIYFCKRTQERASKMDTPRLIRGPDDQLIETGCFTGFLRICNLAHNNDPRRQYDMGTFFRDGKLPVSESRVNAYTWFSLAAQGGGEVTLLVPTAKRQRDKVAAKMSEDEIVEAERLVAEWEPNPAECERIGAQAEN